MQTERLFLAVDLTADARAALQRHLAAAVPKGLPGRVVPPESWHLTLRFLGDTPAERRGALAGELGRAPLGPPFTVSVARLGAFPRPGRASVLWIGVDAGALQLGALAGTCEHAARRAGYAAEEKPFTAHLTLSRLRAPQDLAPLLQRVAPADIRFEVRELTLFRSRLGGGPARYEPVARWPLD